MEDSPFFTSSDVSAGTDMALSIIKKLFGQERAKMIANLTKFIWHDDPNRDLFYTFLNQEKF